MDLILGRFADSEISDLSDDEITQLEALIEVPDPDLYAALTGDAPLASPYAGPMFNRVKSFRPGGQGAWGDLRPFLTVLPGLLPGIHVFFLEP